MASQKRRRSPSMNDALPMKKKMRIGVEEQAASVAHTQELGKPHLNMEMQDPGHKVDDPVALPTVQSSLPPKHSNASEKLPSPAQSIVTTPSQPLASEVLTFVKDRGETYEMFLGRIRHGCDYPSLWRIMPSLEAVPAEQVALMKSVVERQVSLHLPDPSAEPDTDDEREGRYSHELASLPQWKRKSLLRAQILLLGEEHGILRGKWVVFFHNRRELFDVYERVALEHEQGRLGIAIEARYDDPAHDGVLFVWTKDMNDVEDIRAVAVALGRLGIQSQMRYKPEMFTLLGLQSGNEWGIKITQYTSHELLRKPW